VLDSEIARNKKINKRAFRIFVNGVSEQVAGKVAAKMRPALQPRKYGGPTRVENDQIRCTRGTSQPSGQRRRVVGSCGAGNIVDGEEVSTNVMKI
jgi:hypothetical protein